MKESRVVVKAKLAENLYFHTFSIELYGEKGSNHISRFPDLFRTVPRPENAYLAPSCHPKQTVKKWRGGFFSALNKFSVLAAVDRASDRKDPL